MIPLLSTAPATNTLSPFPSAGGGRVHAPPAASAAAVRTGDPVGEQRVAVDEIATEPRRDVDHLSGAVDVLMIKAVVEHADEYALPRVPRIVHGGQVELLQLLELDAVVDRQGRGRRL